MARLTNGGGAAPLAVTGKYLAMGFANNSQPGVEGVRVESGLRTFSQD